MTQASPVAIIGLGLMGGSLARDLAARSVPVLAHDANPEVLAAACAEGVVQRPLPKDLTGVESAGIVVLATPVDVAIDILPGLRDRIGPTAVVTDVGSTKRAIERRATEIGLADRFVGSHPLAGDHRSGWAAARTNLYTRVPVFICPTPVTTEGAISRIAELWSLLGAVPTRQEAAEHDRRMAWISHLPQLLSSALAGVLTESGLSPREVGPGGRDMTRLAASSPEMWTAISRANADNLLAALERTQAQLAAAEAAIRNDDPSALLDFFRRGREWLS